MNYSVILIEDESITLNELLLTIPWNELGLTVSGTAGNGLEGEELIKKEAPDIVITDIRLPGQDGLEMLSHCPVNYAIILSGHTDFSYAKRAIKLGVFDYLEKPVDDDELIETLKNVVAKLNEDHRSMKNDRQGSSIIDLPEEVPNHIINLALTFIIDNYNKPIGLQDVSEFTRTSENHLSTLFREITGINFLQYLNGYRINKSAELLRTTNLNISEVAEKCGFPTPSYFTKIFRRFAGVTPTQYRDSIE